MRGSPPTQWRWSVQRDDIPEVHGMPLEGEWTVCASGRVVKNSSGDTDESNALLDVPIMMPERADGSSKSKKTGSTTEVESNGYQILADMED